jgi:hypothetical protein
MSNDAPGSFSPLALLQTLAMYVVLIGLLVFCLFGQEDDSFISEATTFQSPDPAVR